MRYDREVLRQSIQLRKLVGGSEQVIIGDDFQKIEIRLVTQNLTKISTAIADPNPETGEAGQQIAYLCLASHISLCVANQLSPNLARTHVFRAGQQRRFQIGAESAGWAVRLPAKDVLFFTVWE